MDQWSRPDNTERIRLFAGCQFDDGTNRALGALQCTLKDVRWMQPATFHSTLQFFGYVAKSLVPAIDSALSGVQGHVMTLSTDGAGFFSQRERRILYAQIAPSAPLCELHNKIQTCLAGIIPMKQSSAFRPHITLGRTSRHPPSVKEMRDWIAFCRELGTISIQLRSFNLVASVLKPDGAAHTVLRSYALKDAER